LDARTKELVAVGASVVGRCQPCFRHHLSKARELGINAEDVQEAIRLGTRIGEVGGWRMTEFVDSVMKEQR
jgi:AhpD family alkylhydroperoxidase